MLLNFSELISNHNTNIDVKILYQHLNEDDPKGLQLLVRSLTFCNISANCFKYLFISFQAMINDNADEVVLETEITNKPALKLYENLGFVRDKRLFRYYLNGVDALRLKLWLR